MTTPNMALTLPVVSQTPGPTWASEINADLSLIDSHNHTSGNGALVPVAGLNINADLSLATNALTNVERVGLLDQASLASLNSVYANNGELWWNDGSGNNVKITNNGAVNVGPTGNIGGMIGSCAVTYLTGPLSYEFLDQNAVLATLDASAVNVSSVHILNATITASGAGSYTLNLPSAMPANTSFVTCTAAGQLAYTSQTAGITNTMLAGSIEPIKVLNYSGTDNFDGQTVTGTSWVGVASVVLTTKSNTNPIIYAIQGVNGSSLIPNASCSGGTAGTNAVFFRVAINDGSSVTFHNGGANYFVGATGTIPCTFGGLLLSPPVPTSGTTISVTLQASADTGVTVVFNDTNWAVTQL
jgi:hypothetical protein